MEYRRLCCSDRDEVWKFLDDWRLKKGDDVEEHLDDEVRGIHEILKNCSVMPVEMGGVYVDNKLEAFSIGSFTPLDNMAIIHIEKANPDLRGLYQYIYRDFLIHAFPGLSLLNLEADSGPAGPASAAIAYDPVLFAQ